MNIIENSPRIGLIAGNGIFPLLFAQAAKKQQVKIIALAIHGETSLELTQYVDAIKWVYPGQLKKIFRFFKAHKIKQAAMAGGVSKVRLIGKIRPDFLTMKLLTKCVFKHDDGMLRILANEFFQRGIEIIDSTSFMPDALAPQGVLTKRIPSKTEENDLQFGFNIAKEIGKLDIGQTVIVKKGAVIALEAIEGTDACIKRSKTYINKSGGIMVKTSKPNQDMRFDLPAIGVKTIHSLHSAGINTLGIEAHRTLLLNPKNIINTANKLNISIIGLPWHNKS